MQTFSICQKPSVSWCLFANDQGTFCPGDQFPAWHVAIALSEVRRAFLQIFGNEVVSKHPLLSVVYNEEGPVCFSGQTLIFLSASHDVTLFQHMYQFSHELCHFMVNGKVCESYRWFEETLCTMMSWYALLSIYRSRDTAPCKVLSANYDKMPRYLNRDIKRARLEGMPISEFVRGNLEHLQKECYDRPMNAAIAHELFPLFIKNPELWGIVPFLGQIKEGALLNDALGSLEESAGLPPVVSDLLHQRLLGQ